MNNETTYKWIPIAEALPRLEGKEGYVAKFHDGSTQPIYGDVIKLYKEDLSHVLLPSSDKSYSEKEVIEFTWWLKNTFHVTSAGKYLLDGKYHTIHEAITLFNQSRNHE